MYIFPKSKSYFNFPKQRFDHQRKPLNFSNNHALPTFPFFVVRSFGASPFGKSVDKIIKPGEIEKFPKVLEGHKADQEELNAFGASAFGKSVDKIIQPGDIEMFPKVLEGHEANQEELNACGATASGKSVENTNKMGQ
jgi:hypothetical protein